MILDKMTIEKEGLSLDEFLVLMMVMNNVDFTRAKESVVRKGLALGALDFGNGLGLEKTQLGVITYNNIVLKSTEQAEVNEERLLNLAERMRKIFPTGKKEGTNLYWSDGAGVIARRLRTFFHKYDKAGRLTDDQIIEATQRYVDEMSGKTDMRLLRYFIFKEPVGKGGDVEPVSDLLTYIENKGQQTTPNEDRFVTLY